MSNSVEHVRDLARQVAEIANSEWMGSIRRLWARHNNLEKVERPPVLCRPAGGVWAQLVPQDTLVSSDPLHRSIENTLRQHLYHATVLQDDWVIEPWVDVPAVPLGEDRPMMWGVNVDVIVTDTVSDHGKSFAFKPEIKEEEDIEKLRVPDWHVDEQATQEKYEKAGELLDGILDVRIQYCRLGHGSAPAYWGAYLRGLEQMMYDAMDRPEWLHRFISFITNAELQNIKGLEAAGHLDRNDNGMLGHCDGLPQPDFDGEHVRLEDMWGGGDSQEFDMVSPVMWDEFLLSHQLPILKLYGLTSYGCCENLHGKFEILKAKVPNLRRVSSSPWSPLEYMAEQAGRDYVIQVRPMPSDVLLKFDEDDMRRDITEKMEIAGAGIMDFCLQDIETVDDRPETLPLWTHIAQEIGAEMYNR